MRGVGGGREKKKRKREEEQSKRKRRKTFVTRTQDTFYMEKIICYTLWAKKALSSLFSQNKSCTNFTGSLFFLLSKRLSLSFRFVSFLLLIFFVALYVTFFHTFESAVVWYHANEAAAIQADGGRMFCAMLLGKSFAVEFVNCGCELYANGVLHLSRDVSTIAGTLGAYA